MATNPANNGNSIVWRDLYRAAMLELRGEVLRQRIDEAEAAIQQRISELRTNDSDCAEESQQLTDALRGLRVLASTECQSSQPILPGFAPNEVAS